jgi:hypothetical protein
MPTEIGRPSAQTIEQPRAPDTPPLSMALLGAVAVLTLVLHLATGAVLYRSHAGEIGSTATGATGDLTVCASEAKPLERTLPYD